jgi:hypothetical protein
MTETELLAALDVHDQLLRLCASGGISFNDFVAKYNNFYWSYALDGHESDGNGIALLLKHADRIAVHKAVAEEVLVKLCTDADSTKESYQRAGRIGSVEALARIRRLAAENPERKA